MKFPVIIRHRREKATIYGKSAGYSFYRLGYYVAGQRRVRSFKTYGEAKTEAERIVRELADGSQAAALNGAQSRDALAAMQRLDALRQSTGRRVSLLAAVSEFAEASVKAHGRNLVEIVEGYQNTVASVKRKGIAEAVEEFIKADEPRTKAGEGQRAQWCHPSMRVFAHCGCADLQRHSPAMPSAICRKSTWTKSHSYSLKKSGAKSRNHHRAGIKQFVQWCIRKDYLPANHRLNEADTMRPEHANTGEIGFYTPKEFRAMLETAQAPMREIIAIGGFAGLRTAEILRLTWEEVFRVPGHIEVTAGKAKTRQRRLVEVCPALAAWLEPCRKLKGKLWDCSERCFHKSVC